jgi:voltage-gated potassium channel
MVVRDSAPWHRFETAVLLVLAVLTFGTLGYVVVGLGPFDALYQTAITISTVGYGEVGPADEVDRTYRGFTLVLVLVAASSIVYTASVLVETLVEGTVNDSFRRRRMQHRVDRLQDHVIVAGWGRVGRSIARYARRQGRPVVALEQDGAVVDGEDDVPVIVGDATDEDALMAAGIDRATSLIAALGDSSANLALVLTARSLREDLRIVARIADPRDERKFIRAGADRVVNPYDIGGSRMAAIALRPHVAEFLDEVVHSDEHDVDIQEVRVAAGSPAIGAQLGDVTDTPVVALKDADGDYTFTPPPERRLAAGDLLIAVGSAEQLAALKDALAAPASPTPSSGRGGR